MEVFMLCRWAIPCLLFVAAWLAAGQAVAYCRTTVCDTQSQEPCPIDENACTASSEDNPYASWPDGCASYVVQRDGSRKNGISAAQLESTVQSAFEVWTEAPCGGGQTAALFVQSQGEVTCAAPEFNCAEREMNFNDIMFQEDTWVHARSALALTTVTLNLKTGEILDADMEINAVHFSFVTEPNATDNNLLAVVTHEVGHFLGLNHSRDTEATMYTYYDASSSDVVQLAADDAAGICDVFGGASSDPDCDTLDAPESSECLGGSDCPPRKVESSSCSCSLQPSSSVSVPLLLGFVLVMLVARRRRTGLLPALSCLLVVSGGACDRPSGDAAKEKTTPSAEPKTELPSEFVDGMKVVLKRYEALQIALAYDRVGPMEFGAAQLAEETQAVVPHAPAKEKARLSHLIAAAKVMAKCDPAKVDEVRKMFGDLSRPLVGLLEAEPALRFDYRVFECPKGDGYAKWVQHGTKMANPYTGRKLPACGGEVTWPTR